MKDLKNMLDDCNPGYKSFQKICNIVELEQPLKLALCLLCKRKKDSTIHNISMVDEVA